MKRPAPELKNQRQNKSQRKMDCTKGQLRLLVCQTCYDRGTSACHDLSGLGHSQTPNVCYECYMTGIWCIPRFISSGSVSLFCGGNAAATLGSPSTGGTSRFDSKSPKTAASDPSSVGKRHDVCKATSASTTVDGRRISRVSGSAGHSTPAANVASVTKTAQTTTAVMPADAKFGSMLSKILANQETMNKQQNAMAEQLKSLASQQTTLVEQQNSVAEKLKSLTEQQTTLAEQQKALGNEQNTLANQQRSLKGQQDTMATTGETMLEQQEALIRHQESMAAGQKEMVDQQKALAAQHDAMIAGHEAVLEQQRKMTDEYKQIVNVYRDIVTDQKSAAEEKQRLNEMIIKMLQTSGQTNTNNS